MMEADTESKALKSVIQVPPPSATPTVQNLAIHRNRKDTSSMVVCKRYLLIFQFKALTVLMQTVILALGVHSFFKSFWAWEWHPFYRPWTETAFIFITIIVFVMTLANFMFSLNYNYNCDKIRLWEKIYHIIAGVLTLLAGGCYLYAAMNIHAGHFLHYKRKPGSKMPQYKYNVSSTAPQFDAGEYYVQLYDEKIAAGSLSIANSCLYFLTGYLIGSGYFLTL